MAVGFVFHPGQAATVIFEADVRPILKAHCFRCHGEDGSAKGGLDVRLHKLLLKGGKHGTAIVPGQAEKSLLYTKIRDGKMPKEQAKLPAAQIETIRLWIEQGAKWQNHWAFIPAKRPGLPLGQARAGGWPLNAIDHFILARLRAGQLAPSPVAARRTLIRRATLDLTGLPPTPAEIEAFAADSSPRAYERLVDRLIASSRYGEHMAQAWLDAARYADTNGFQSDSTRNQWHWRDWVVDALNRNMPFDQFTIEQLAE